ncbi:MAG: glycine betaine ABC transporter substrate-binding protein [Candidatus Marithrix sp.]|nr:glycine betaine ABC transporter substrate-binding protein [Candidatus Marithrix sp.]
MIKNMLKIVITFLVIFGIAYAEENEPIEITYVEWSSEVASANVIKVVLEKIGVEVDIIPVTAAAMWQAVASSDVDAHVAAWLYTTHSHYLEAVQEDIEYLGPNLKGTKTGLIVPEYVTINSISELNANLKKFRKRIIGIDPGAGLMSKTEQVIEEYGLKKFKLVEGSGAAMTASLEDAIKNKEWIVVTGWTPHWIFSRWKLKYLDDPKMIYNPKDSRGEEHIGTIVRKGLKADNPKVYKVLDNFLWEPSDMEQVMIWNEKRDSDPYDNAVRWVNENSDKVNKWIGE